MAISAPWEGSITALKGMLSKGISKEEDVASHHHDCQVDLHVFVGNQACLHNERMSSVRSTFYR